MSVEYMDVPEEVQCYTQMCVVKQEDKSREPRTNAVPFLLELYASLLARHVAAASQLGGSAFQCALESSVELPGKSNAFRGDESLLELGDAGNSRANSILGEISDTHLELGGDC